jgi:hypothetical protein
MAEVFIVPEGGSSMGLAVKGFTGYLGLEQIANCINYENHLHD